MVYSEFPWGVAFASEIPALMQLPNADSSLSVSALAMMFSRNFRHIADPYTIYNKVQRLRPGHAMVFQNGLKTREYRYWNPECVKREVSPSELRAKIEESISIRSSADVPISCLLSGGVDSTAISAILNEKYKRGFSTFSLGRDEKDEDLVRARIVAKQLGTDHHEYTFHPDKHFEYYKRILQTYGEPIALLPLIYSYELCSQISKTGTKVVMSGIGADELFYGYNGHLKLYYISKILDLLEHVLTFIPIKFRENLGKNFPYPFNIVISPPCKRKAVLYSKKNGQLTKVFSKTSLSELQNYAFEQLSYWGDYFSKLSYIDESSILALLIENAHSLSVSSDLPPMMATVEIRAPFLDQELIEMAFSIPYKKKVRKLDNHWCMKAILKEAVSSYVPEELRNAPKRGFGFGLQEKDIFLNSWKEHLDQYFSSDNDLGGMLLPGGISEIWKDFSNSQGTCVDASFVSRLLSLQIWAAAK